MKGVSIQEEQ